MSSGLELESFSESWLCVSVAWTARVGSSLHAASGLHGREGYLLWLLSKHSRLEASCPPMYVRPTTSEGVRRKLGETEARRQCQETRDRESDVADAAVSDLESDIFFPSVLWCRIKVG